MTNLTSDNPQLKLLEQLLDGASWVSDSAEVFYLYQKDVPVLFEANRLKLVEERESSGVALRIIKNGKIGFASTSNLANLDKLIADALDMAPLGPDAKLVFPEQSTFPHVDLFDPQTENISLDSMVQLGQSAIDQTLRFSPQLLCDAEVERGFSSMTILNSAGCSTGYTRSTFEIGLYGTLVSGTDMLFVSDSQSSCRPITDSSQIVEGVRQQLESSQNIVSAPVGQVPVIFTPRGVGGTLLSPLMAGFNGKTLLQGTSPMVGKLGEELFDRRFSMWDEPTHPFAPGSRICDDEGMAARRLPLIENGVVANFLYDLQTAAQGKVESTASAHRGLESAPSPGPSVLMVGEGDAEYAEMLKDMGDGLVVETLLGAGQSNILGGDFNANVLLGYRVANGKVIGRVKNTVISGNVYKVLKNVRALEKDTHWVGGSLRCPAIYVDGVSVASKQP